MLPTQPLNFQTPCFFFSQGFVVPECDCKLEGHRLPPGHHHLTDNWTRQQPGGQAGALSPGAGEEPEVLSVLAKCQALSASSFFFPCCPCQSTAIWPQPV